MSHISWRTLKSLFLPTTPPIRRAIGRLAESESEASDFGLLCPIPLVDIMRSLCRCGPPHLPWQWSSTLRRLPYLEAYPSTWRCCGSGLRTAWPGTRIGTPARCRPASRPRTTATSGPVARNHHYSESLRPMPHACGVSLSHCLARPGTRVQRADVLEPATRCCPMIFPQARWNAHGGIWPAGCGRHNLARARPNLGQVRAEFDRIWPPRPSSDRSPPNLRRT